MGEIWKAWESWSYAGLSTLVSKFGGPVRFLSIYGGATLAIGVATGAGIACAVMKSKQSDLSGEEPSMEEIPDEGAAIDPVETSSAEGESSSSSIGVVGQTV